MARPIVSVIAAGPTDAVPPGILWEAISLPSLVTDEVKLWIAEHRQGPVYVVPAAEIASKGTPSLPVAVTVDEFLTISKAIAR